MNNEELLNLESLMDRRDELKELIEYRSKELKEIESQLRDVDRMSYIVLTCDDIVGITQECGGYPTIKVKKYTKISPISSAYDTIKSLMLYIQMGELK